MREELMLSILTICCCLTTQVDVTVKPLQGDAVTGKLTVLTEKKVTVQEESGPQEFEARGLQSLRPAGTGAASSRESRGAIVVELVDGSVFTGTTFTSIGGTCTTRIPAGSERTFSTRLVRAVRFHRQDESVRRQWESIAAEERVGDVLIVRKVDPAATGAAQIVLDQLPGVVRDVGESTVNFEFDGDRLDVPRAKIEGILFRSPRDEDTPEPACRVRDAEGGLWNARSVRLQDSKLMLETVAGMSATLEWGRVLEVDFSAGNIVFLADLETESMEWRPYFQSPGTPHSLSRWFEPRTMSAVLNGESYDKTLALHSRSTLTYRLTRDYRQLVATVGVDERYRQAANLTVTIFGDGRPLWTRAVAGGDEPFNIAVDLAGVRRLKILVDFGEDRSDAGDLLYLGDARLVK